MSDKINTAIPFILEQAEISLLARISQLSAAKTIQTPEVKAVIQKLANSIVFGLNEGQETLNQELINRRPALSVIPSTSLVAPLLFTLNNNDRDGLIDIVEDGLDNKTEFQLILDLIDRLAATITNEIKRLIPSIETENVNQVIINIWPLSELITPKIKEAA